MAATTSQQGSADVTLLHLQSSQSLRVLWALIYCEVPHKVTLIQRRADRTYPEILQLSALGKAPVLTIGDKVYTESRLCIEQVRKLAQSALSKKDETEAERDDYFSEFSTATLDSTVKILLWFELVGANSPLVVRPLMKGLTSVIVSKLKDELSPILRKMEDALTPEMPFFGGKKLGVSDLMMSWPLDLSVQRRFIDLNQWPNLKVWYDSVQGMQSYQQALKETKLYDLTKF